MSSHDLLSSLARGLQSRRGGALHRQIYHTLLEAIAAGSLPPGQRLPSTRQLAATFGVSRNTVLLAFEQLRAEGHLVAEAGSGTFVNEAAAPARAADRRPPRLGAAVTVQLRHVREVLAQTHPDVQSYGKPPVPFRSYYPALKEFPVLAWNRVSADVNRRLAGGSRVALMGEGDPLGYLPLRTEIARQMGLRGVRCTAENVVITDGTQQALDITCRLILEAGDAAWCEDPGYSGMRASILAAGGRIVDVPVDAQGMDVAAGVARAPEARLAYVSPANQCPLGMAMTLGRRLQLLDWASDAGAWIIEDDYDSDLRFDGAAAATLQALDGSVRVIYLNTFTKTLFPALRLGFAIVPDSLVDAFAGMRQMTSRFSPHISQAVVAEFMARGHYARHLNRMRAIYARRHAALLEFAEKYAAPWLTITPTQSGIQVIGTLAPLLTGAEVARAAAAEGLTVMPLSAFYRGPAGEASNKIRLGFGEFDTRQLEKGMARLGALLARLHGG